MRNRLGGLLHFEAPRVPGAPLVEHVAREFIGEWDAAGCEPSDQMDVS